MSYITGTFADIISNFKTGWEVFYSVWYIVLPVVLYYPFKIIWMEYRQAVYAATIEFVTLEIIPPRDIEKSPKPMESIYIGLSGILTTFNTFEEFGGGKFTDKFSFEMAGIEGTVRFFIHVPVSRRKLVEAHFYAQYPGVEINEVPDYVQDVPRIIPNKDWDLWGTDFALVKPDPYPIRTYKYFEEDITGTMIDPFSALIESAGKTGPGEQIWMQYVIVPEPEVKSTVIGKEEVQKLAGRIGKPEGFLSRLITDVGDVVGNIFSGAFGAVEFKTEEKKLEQPLEFRLTPVEKDVLKALENNVGKNMFKTKMRFIYLGRKEIFDKIHVSSFIGGIKQFADLNLNSFKPEEKSKTYANYVLRKSRLQYRQRKIFRRYRDRDLDGYKFFLSTEEMATVYHLPDMNVVSPFTPRIESKRGGAPANLPIG